MRIEVHHLSLTATLPLHHRDPFDHLLIAQVMIEKMPVVGADQMFDAYGIERLW